MPGNGNGTNTTRMLNGFTCNNRDNVRFQIKEFNNLPK